MLSKYAQGLSTSMMLRDIDGSESTVYFSKLDGQEGAPGCAGLQAQVVHAAVWAHVFAEGGAHRACWVPPQGES